MSLQDPVPANVTAEVLELRDSDELNMFKIPDDAMNGKQKCQTKCFLHNIAIIYLDLTYKIKRKTFAYPGHGRCTGSLKVTARKASVWCRGP